MTAMPSQSEKSQQFQALHRRSGAFVMPNPWDAGSARLLQELGFEALATSSGALAVTLGRRDGAVTRDEVLAHARALVDATEIPVSADLEDGYGATPEAVAETIRLAAEAGVVGGSIEDAGGEDHRIFDFNHAVERVAAAAEAARALSFTFTARAENFLRGRPNLDDTIRRLQAFAAAGADVVYAPSLPGLTAIGAVCAAVPKPVNVMVVPKGQTFPVADLAAAGVKRISLGPTLLQAAMKSAIDAAREIRTRGTFGFADSAPTFRELAKLVGG